MQNGPRQQHITTMPAKEELELTTQALVNADHQQPVLTTSDHPSTEQANVTTSAATKKGKGYRGNKGIKTLYPNIINEFPPHKVFWELCAGSAQISWLKKPALMTIAIEINPAMVQAAEINYPPGTVVICDDVQNWLPDIMKVGPDHLVYIDMPYLPESRPNSPKIYEFEMPREKHLEILRSLKELRCRVSVSHYECAEYDEILTGWRKKVVKVSYHGTVKNEAIYFNYAVPEVLHETTFTGKNKTHRQQLKRKADRLCQKIIQLPTQERQFVLTALDTFVKKNSIIINP